MFFKERSEPRGGRVQCPLGRRYGGRNHSGLLLSISACSGIVAQDGAGSTLQPLFQLFNSPVSAHWGTFFLSAYHQSLCVQELAEIGPSPYVALFSKPFIAIWPIPSGLTFIISSSFTVLYVNRTQCCSVWISAGLLLSTIARKGSSGGDPLTS